MEVFLGTKVIVKSYSHVKNPKKFEDQEAAKLLAARKAQNLMTSITGLNSQIPVSTWKPDKHINYGHWILAGWSPKSICGVLDLFSFYEDFGNRTQRIWFANGTYVRARGKGEVNFYRQGDPTKYTLKNVYYVPECQTNLVTPNDLQAIMEFTVHLSTYFYIQFSNVKAKHKLKYNDNSFNGYWVLRFTSPWVLNENIHVPAAVKEIQNQLSKNDYMFCHFQRGHLNTKELISETPSEIQCNTQFEWEPLKSCLNLSKSENVVRVFLQEVKVANKKLYICAIQNMNTGFVSAKPASTVKRAVSKVETLLSDFYGEKTQISLDLSQLANVDFKNRLQKKIMKKSHKETNTKDSNDKASRDDVVIKTIVNIFNWIKSTFEVADDYNHHIINIATYWMNISSYPNLEDEPNCHKSAFELHHNEEPKYYLLRAVGSTGYFIPEEKSENGDHVVNLDHGELVGTFEEVDKKTQNMKFWYVFLTGKTSAKRLMKVTYALCAEHTYIHENTTVQNKLPNFDVVEKTPQIAASLKNDSVKKMLEEYYLLNFSYEYPQLFKHFSAYFNWCDWFLTQCKNVEIYEWKRVQSVESLEKIFKYYEQEYAIGDGNCMFHSLSTLLFRDDSKSFLIRLLLITFIVKNWCKFYIIADEIWKMPIGEVIRRLVKPTGWGNSGDLRVFSTLFEKPIVVYNPDKEEVAHGFKTQYCLHQSFVSKDPLVLHLADSHFTPLIPRRNADISKRTAELTRNCRFVNNFKFNKDFSFATNVQSPKVEEVAISDSSSNKSSPKVHGDKSSEKDTNSKPENLKNSVEKVKKHDFEAAPISKHTVMSDKDASDVEQNQTFWNLERRDIRDSAAELQSLAQDHDSLTHFVNPENCKLQQLEQEIQAEKNRQLRLAQELESYEKQIMIIENDILQTPKPNIALAAQGDQACTYCEHFASLFQNLSLELSQLTKTWTKQQDMKNSSRNNSTGDSLCSIVIGEPETDLQKPKKYITELKMLIEAAQKSDVDASDYFPCKIKPFDSNNVERAIRLIENDPNNANTKKLVSSTEQLVQLIRKERDIPHSCSSKLKTGSPPKTKNPGFAADVTAAAAIDTDAAPNDVCTSENDDDEEESQLSCFSLTTANTKGNVLPVSNIIQHGQNQEPGEQVIKSKQLPKLSPNSTRVIVDEKQKTKTSKDSLSDDDNNDLKVTIPILTVGNSKKIGSSSNDRSSPPSKKAKITENTTLNQETGSESNSITGSDFAYMMSSAMSSKSNSPPTTSKSITLKETRRCRFCSNGLDKTAQNFVLNHLVSCIEANAERLKCGLCPDTEPSGDAGTLTKPELFSFVALRKHLGIHIYNDVQKYSKQLKEIYTVAYAYTDVPSLSPAASIVQPSHLNSTRHVTLKKNSEAKENIPETKHTFLEKVAKSSKISNDPVLRKLLEEDLNITSSDGSASSTSS